MGNFLKLKKLYESGLFVGDCVANWGYINCDKLARDTPKKVWLVRRNCVGCGDQSISYTLTFLDPEDTDALVGLWIGQEGNGYMVDATSPDELISSCKTCCDTDQTAVTTTYTNMGTGVSTIPAIVGGTNASYCITRADDGSIFAQNKFQKDYYGKIKSAVLFSASGTSSKYTVVSVVKPTAILPDTIANSACS